MNIYGKRVKGKTKEKHHLNEQTHAYCFEKYIYRHPCFSQFDLTYYSWCVVPVWRF